MNDTKRIPELLAPAGSPEALDAAIAAGADAVYFGGGAFNARMNAKNFVGDALADAIKKCRLYGVKTNITLNTLVHTREMEDVLNYVHTLYTLGADALIVADIGAARLIRRYFPDMELHASTQAAGHNAEAARVLAELGFTRMVAAREMSREDLTTLCKQSPIETEMFIHGAICVSQSGQCLASSLIGGRSGNRGECAQPCRLPYSSCQKNSRDTYALSLKDMCLAGHITEILDLGVSSLKIEGRMKSPDYVYGVTSIYRRLLDEGRNATEAEISQLRALFSRSGFTDSYFKGKTGRDMLGIRTDADKAQSAGNTENTDFTALIKARRRPIIMKAAIQADKPSMLTVSLGDTTAAACGNVPEAAKNCPLDADSVRKNLEKLGSTPFTVGELDITLGEGLMMPVSALNALRRSATDELAAMLTKPRECELPTLPPPPKESRVGEKSARFISHEQIPDDIEDIAAYIPLEGFRPEMADKVDGVIIPPVVFDSEREAIADMLSSAKNAGVRHALVSNLGHISLAKEAGMEVHGDFRMNVYNRYTADALYELGFADIIASPELTLPQLRDLGLAPVIYGRVPLMTLEKCAIRDLYSCEECKAKTLLPLGDRKGARFLLCRTFDHRNIMYNSVPVYMEDKRDELIKYRIVGGHYIFTDETGAYAKDILCGNVTGAKSNIRRIPK